MARGNAKKKGYLLVGLALIGVLIYLFAGSVKVDIGTDSLTASGTLSAAVTIPYGEINEYELRDNIPIGSRSFGLSTLNTVSGQYSSPAFGAYTLFAYKNVSKFIILRYSGGILVFNLQDETETVKCFEQISEKAAKTPSADPGKNTNGSASVIANS